MKLLCCLAFITCFAFNSTAQSGGGKVIYRYTVAPPQDGGTINMSNAKSLLANLFFNDTSFLYQEINPAISQTNDTRRPSDNAAVITLAAPDSILFEHFFNVRTKRSFIHEKIPLAKFYDYYADNLVPNWTLLQEFKTFGGYKCQKATTQFSGRTWTAWFTTAIPANVGPWKLHGLPGLIVEARDSDNKFGFEMVSVKIPFASTCTGMCSNSKTVTMPFSDYKELLKKRLARIESALKTQGAGTGTVSVNMGDRIDKYFDQ